MKSTLRWLINNFGLILLSVGLAMMVWLAAVEQENPTVERRYSSPIPVTVSNTPPGMVAYHQSDSQVYVTLRAPRLVWDALQAQDLHATVDLGGLGEGTHQVPVQVEVDRRPVMVRQIEPAAITIRLEQRAEAVVPVNVRIAGNTALGYVAQPPVWTPLSVTVSGPASLVTQVVEAVAQVSVEGMRANVEEEFGLEAHDGQGEVVPFVSLSPARVMVRIPIEQLSGYRDLVVTAVLEGQVAPGYSISSVTIDPPVVTAWGSPEVIAQIPGYLETEPLDLDGAQENLEIRLPLRAPEGISLLEPVVTVKVVVVPIRGSITLERVVEIQGLTQGITATVAPTTVQVILGGPLAVLEQLREEDVRVIVDLFGLAPARYPIKPQVLIVPTGITVESVLPDAVQVEITAEGTPSSSGR